MHFQEIGQFRLLLVGNMPAKAKTSNSRLLHIPSVDTVLRSEAGKTACQTVGSRSAALMAREAIDRLRAELIENGLERGRDELVAAAQEILSDLVERSRAGGIQGVVNATGVVVHTNLGRAPLSEAARDAIVSQAVSYCTLEYDLPSGKRGKRGARAEALLRELTGADDVLIVNNCAAAAFFILTVFSSGGEVVISRGELVEIGGDFRVPDVLTQSGAVLREVGTTNRTKISDYKKALNDRTKMVLRVHPSNYRIVGFTASPSVEDLVDLARSSKIVLYEDLGSGALIDLAGIGLSDEPVVADSIAAGVDIVSFSGDKLLGGPQAGVIAGKRELIERLRTHPLYRALRVGKLAYAALEATLDAYGRNRAEEVPVVRMLSMTKAEIAQRAGAFAKQLPNGTLKVELIDGLSAVGGGAAPAAMLETVLIALSHDEMAASDLEGRLRLASPPVIARIADNRVLIDLRTVAEDEEGLLLETLAELAA